MPSTIIETSETESFSSEQRRPSEEVEHSLDDLFGALSRKLKENEQIPELDEDFDQVKQLIDNLPKLKDNLDVQVIQAKQDIVAINDPIVAIRKKKSEDTDSGANWFHMKTQEMTPELKRDLMVIKNRSALDPKRHYKKDNWEIPKYFQMGTIIEGNAEFYSSRMKRKDRGTSLVDEILKDETAGKYFKRKYEDIQQKNKSGGKEDYKKLREKRRRY